MAKAKTTRCPWCRKADLPKPPCVCPSCQTAFPEESLPKKPLTVKSIFDFEGYDPVWYEGGGGGSWDNAVKRREE